MIYAYPFLQWRYMCMYLHTYPPNIGFNLPWRIEPWNDMSPRRWTFGKFWHEILVTQRILQFLKSNPNLPDWFYFQKSQITRFYSRFQEVAKNIERSFLFSFLTFIFGLSQIWLKYLQDGHHFGYITKFKKKKKKKNMR
jgi:hypothetical protein